MMDRAASAGFEGIAQMLLEQKKLMDALEAENRELRRQIADLRRGVGIALVIEGKTIQLASDQGMSAQSQGGCKAYRICRMLLLELTTMRKVVARRVVSNQ